MLSILFIFLLMVLNISLYAGTWVQTEDFMGKLVFLVEIVLIFAALTYAYFTGNNVSI